MTNNNKLKVLIVVLFFFIIILVALLIYAKTVYTKENPADNNISTNSSVGQTDSSTTAASQQSVIASSEAEETIDLKLYFFDAEDYDNAKEVRTVAVDKKLYQENITAAINQVLSSTNIKINKAVINGNSIAVDLPKEVALKFNNGSASGITYTNILAMTVLNLPNIEKLEVTVDGVANVVADHFSFNGTFSRAEDGKKYTFTDSGKASKYLDY